MTDDLAAFVLARVSEREAVATAAPGSGWASWIEGRDHKGGSDILTTGDGGNVYLDYDAGDGPALAGQRAMQDHIALNDPAFILAWCAAVRQVVELHEPGACWGDLACKLCGDRDPDGHLDGGDWPCPTIRALASMWRDHEGYRAEEWA